MKTTNKENTLLHTVITTGFTPLVPQGQMNKNATVCSLHSSIHQIRNSMEFLLSNYKLQHYQPKRHKTFQNTSKSLTGLDRAGFFLGETCGLQAGSKC